MREKKKIKDMILAKYTDMNVPEDIDIVTIPALYPKRKSPCNASLINLMTGHCVCPIVVPGPGWMKAGSSVGDGRPHQ